jgi:hypothetical protein
MKEKEFSRYVQQEKDVYRKQTWATRSTLESYMCDMTKKEVAMKEVNEWNVMSAKDTMIMELMTNLEQAKSTNSKGKSKKNGKAKKSDNEKKDSLHQMIRKMKRQVPPCQLSLESQNCKVQLS